MKEFFLVSHTMKQISKLKEPIYVIFKCPRVRFKDLPKNRYFSIQSENILEILNRLNTKFELKLNDLICINCYNKASRMVANDTINECELLVENACMSQVVEIKDTSTNENKDYNLENNVYNIPANGANVNFKSLEESNKLQGNFVDLPKSFSSHKACMICRKYNEYKKLRVVPVEARTQVMVTKSIFIPKNTRVCSNHFDGNFFIQVTINMIVSTKREVKMSKESIKDRIESL
ncbi:unnamed protein product [Brachionus calyciflorus]|uniref:Uncharacterized protein n=1 Tax=Brachionus calyciflorus TaxID=104777 RepID=A0A813VF88_9BILA|nr:unnamed protein product [Brachionus calyciflorus]